MSEFDREAEKQRLREKFEKDRADREATRRMSELLLKGATMTNMHCDRCGDPIFRHQGREFCPTCEAEAAEAVERPPADGSEATPDAEAAAAEGTAEPTEGDGPAGADTASEQTGGADSSGASSAVPAAGPAGGPVTAPAPSADGDLAEARAAMVRTVTALSRRAEAADDVGRKRTLLAAVREAAEALAAIEDADR